MIAPQLQYLMVLFNGGHHAELESRSRELLSRYPNSGNAWQFLGLALTAQGKDAVDAWQNAARLLPGDAITLNNLGNAQGRAGRTDQAAASYAQALLVRPDFPEAHVNLARALLELGDAAGADAHCREAAGLDPRYADAHATLGDALLASGASAEAAASYARALAIDPTLDEIHNNSGLAMLESGLAEEAMRSFARALDLNPRLAAAHNNLGNAQRGLGKLTAAAACYDRALQLRPEFAAVHSNLAVTRRLQGRTLEAEASCRRALDLNPRAAAPYIVLADLNADRGRFEEAQLLYRQAIAHEPTAVAAWVGLVHSRKMTPADSSWLAQARHVLSSGLTPRHEASLRHAMGKYCDDVGDYEQAFDHFRRANELAKRRRVPHDRARLTQTVDLIIRRCDQRWVRRMQVQGVDSTRPVFIVGMLRSGTSLAEQILASHPAVAGAGELPFWPTALMPDGAVAPLLDTWERSLSSLADEYLRQLGELSSDAVRIVDKMPTNFAFLGVIHAALPHARFIHMRRNPLDTCLSIYCQQFEDTATYANDLTDLAHYYAEYARLMRHWRSVVQPESLLDVCYEELVEQPEAWTRRMLDFIGLPWDPRCLAHHQTERTVLTASKWQVRQKITRSAIGRWHNYERHLAPLFKLAALDRETSPCPR
jgi:tetratricopeptide (TPR) repeat protein